MCGIQGFFSPKRAITYKTLFDTALWLKHRGSTDGFGIVDIDNKKVHRQLWEVNEICKSALKSERGYKNSSVGILTYSKFDEAYYSQRNSKFNEYVEKLKTVNSGGVIFHHRSASVGNVTKNNTHPIIVNECHYIHNGTIYGFEILKQWLINENGAVFNSDTDTELLGHLVEYYVKKHDGDMDEVFDSLVDVVPNFGVLIRITPDSKIDIFKTQDRDLYFFTEDEDIYFISEPTSANGRYNNLFSMIEGHLSFEGEINFSDNELFNDLSERWVIALNDWRYAIANKRCSEANRKCSKCTIEKEGVMSFTASETTLKEHVSLCFECFLLSDVRVNE